MAVGASGALRNPWDGAAAKLQASATTAEAALKRAREEVEEAEQRGDLQGGIDIFTAAILQFPMSAKLYNARAALYMKMGNFAEAMVDASKAKDLASRSQRQNPVMSALRPPGPSAAEAAALPASKLDLGAYLDVPEMLSMPRITADADPALDALAGVGEAGGKEVTVRMKLRFEADYGETVWLSGNVAALGGWQPGKGVQLRTSSETFPLWQATVAIPLVRAPLPPVLTGRVSSLLPY
jgi:tetratricopeptide (TPR) repeat protein